MIYLLLQSLNQIGYRIPAAFFFVSTRMVLAAVTSLLIVILLGPRCIKKLYELKTGQTIRVEDCPMLLELHQKKKDTPSMGGILIIGAIVIASFLWMDWTYSFTWILILTLIWMGWIGFRDDYLKMRLKNSKGLSPRKKMLAQITLAGVLCLYFMVPQVSETLSKCGLRAPTAKVFTTSNADKGESLTTQEYIGRYYVPFVKDPVVVATGIGLLGAAIFVMLVLTASSNAVNLTDGLDGLAAGCSILVAMVLAVFAFVSNHVDLSHYLNILYIEGSGEVAIFLCGVAGACLGFLWYNGYPAQVFMGDTGSLALGGVLGVSAILLRRELLFALVGAVFVAEAFSVILQVVSFRYRNKKRIFLCTPLHHHFEYKGWHETKIVLRFWIVGLLFALIAVSSLKLQ